MHSHKRFSSLRYRVEDQCGLACPINYKFQERQGINWKTLLLLCVLQIAPSQINVMASLFLFSFFVHFLFVSSTATPFKLFHYYAQWNATTSSILNLGALLTSEFWKPWHSQWIPSIKLSNSEYNLCRAQFPKQWKTLSTIVCNHNIFGRSCSLGSPLNSFAAPSFRLLLTFVGNFLSGSWSLYVVELGPLVLFRKDKHFKKTLNKAPTNESRFVISFKHRVRDLNFSLGAYLYNWKIFSQ